MYIIILFLSIGSSIKHFGVCFKLAKSISTSCSINASKMNDKVRLAIEYALDEGEKLSKTIGGGCISVHHSAGYDLSIIVRRVRGGDGSSPMPDSLINRMLIANWLVDAGADPGVAGAITVQKNGITWTVLVVNPGPTKQRRPQGGVCLGLVGRQRGEVEA